MASNIHPTAIVHPGAQLGEGVEVGPYAVIDGEVSIGAGTVVGPHAYLTGRTIIGANNHIFHSAQIGVLSQDLKHKKGLLGKTRIGDNNQIREFVTISASTLRDENDEDRETTIGNGCLLMANSHVGHDTHLGNNIIMANSTALSGHVTVQDRANMGGLTGVHQEVTIGQFSFVGGMSRVNQDVLPYMIVEGHPARCHGPNTIGLQRAGFDEAARKRIKQMYRLLYRAQLNVSQALDRIEQDIEPSPERDVILTFVRNSKRGLT